MDLPFMEGFLIQDYGSQCSKNRYCFSCGTAFCSHCCPTHWLHHNGRARIAEVRNFGELIVINADDSKGVGYSWSGISWFRKAGGRWMHLHSPHIPLPQSGYPHFCHLCNSKIKSGFSYCSIACKINHLPNANGSFRVEQLLGADMDQARRDAFCTRCRSTFSSAHCDSHVILYHPNQIAEVIEVSVHNGWFVVEANNAIFPPAIFENVQVIEVNGVVMHPVCNNRMVQDATGGINHCGSLLCNEGIPEGVLFCSLKCKARI